MARYYQYEGLAPENLTAVSCFVCGQDDSRTVGVDNGFRIRECTCGFVFVNPRPDATQLASFYEKYYDPSDIVPEKWE